MAEMKYIPWWLQILTSPSSKCTLETRADGKCLVSRGASFIAAYKIDEAENPENPENLMVGEHGLYLPNGAITKTKEALCDHFKEQLAELKKLRETILAQ